MGQIHVDGIGIVEIAGDTPTEEEARAIAAGVSGQGAPADAPPERSFGERMLRQVGLGGRAIATGLMRLPNAVGDAINAGVNVGIRGVNAATGAQIPELGAMSDVVNRGIDAVTPQPENATERVVQRVGSDLVSLGAGMGAANAARAIGPVANRVADVVTARVPSQIAASTLASTGAALGREQMPDPDYGDGPRPNISLPTVGEIAGTVAGGVAGAGASAVGGAARVLSMPFRQTGREEMAQRALLRATSDPATLGNRLANGPRQIVPGSQRTTAEVADDPGLLGVERTWRGTDTNAGAQFALRDAERTDARRMAVDAMAPGRARTTAYDAGTQARRGLEANREAMDTQVEQLYQRVPGNIGAFDGNDILRNYVFPAIGPTHQYSTAFSEAMRAAGQNPNAMATAIAGMPTELQPVLRRLAETNRPFVFGEMRAMAREIGEVAGMAAQNGNRTLASSAGSIREALDTAMLFGLSRQQMGDHAAALAARRMMGSLFDEGAVGRALGRNRYGRVPETAPLESIPGALTAGPTAAHQLDGAAAGNPRVLSALRGEMANRLRQTMETTTPGATGETTDSAARFHNFLRQNVDALRTLFGAQGFRNLATIGQDFTSRQMVDSVARVAGSNTQQNLSVASVLAEAFGGLIDPRRAASHPLMRALNAPYRWANAEQAIRETMTHAMIDPDFAQLLVSRATPQTMRAVTARVNGWQRAGDVAGRAIGNTVGPAIPGAAWSLAPRPAGDYPPPEPPQP